MIAIPRQEFVGTHCARWRRCKIAPMMARRWEAGDMPSLEERVAYLEGRFGDQATGMDDLRKGQTEARADLRNGLTDVRTELSEFRADTNRRFDEVRGEVVGLRDETSRWFDEVRGEVVGLRDETSRRFETFDGKIDRHFTWLVGIQVAVLVAVVGALVGSYYR
jgi:hypothetical protein